MIVELSFIDLKCFETSFQNTAYSVVNQQLFLRQIDTTRETPFASISPKRTGLVKSKN